MSTDFVKTDTNRFVLIDKAKKAAKKTFSKHSGKKVKDFTDEEVREALLAVLQLLDIADEDGMIK